jgi:hypothetical protein
MIFEPKRVAALKLEPYRDNDGRGGRSMRTPVSRHTSRTARWLAVGLCAASAAHSDAEPPRAPAAGKPAVTAAPALPIKEFMAHVVAYAAQNLWNKQGWINDKTGMHSLLPKNDQEWEDAESASLTLSEVIGILLQPDRRLPFPGWDSNARAVRALAQQAAAAAEKHDADTFVRIGGELDEACEKCHKAAGL